MRRSFACSAALLVLGSLASLSCDGTAPGDTATGGSPGTGGTGGAGTAGGVTTAQGGQGGLGIGGLGGGGGTGGAADAYLVFASTDTQLFSLDPTSADLSLA